MSIAQIQQLLIETEKLIQFIHKDSFLFKDERSLTILNNTKKNLKDKRYVVSVIAAMKAGKSTTFNALLGRDLLPNETNACTAAITEIKHASSPSPDVKKIYKDGRVVSIFGDEQNTLEEKFHSDVRRSRKENEVHLIDKYFLESPILAIENSAYRDVAQNFILVDTPGPNEANVGDFDVTELQRIGLEKLRDSDALIMLFDFQTFKSDTNATILKNIFENREDLEKDQEKIYFVINKIDALTDKDGTVEEVIEKVKQLIRTYAPVIRNPQVFALSAKQACLARTVMNGNDTEELRNEMKDRYGAKFVEKIEFNGRVLSVIPEPEEFAEALLKESNILTIEDQVIERMFSRSSQKMIQNAFERLEQVTANILTSVQAQIEVSSQNAVELRESVEESKKKIETLRSEGEVLKEIPREKFKELVVKINEILKQLQENVERAIEQNMPTTEVLEGADQETLKQQAKTIQHTMSQAVQLTINREVDKIQRLASDYQGQINQQLNSAFQNLSARANKMVGQNMSLQFQVFNLGDIQSDFSVDSEISSRIQEHSETVGSKSSDIVDDILKGAGVGLGAGLVLPGIGNLAGAIVGGIGGLIKNLMENDSVKQILKVYKLETKPLKEEMLKSSRQTVKKVIQDLQKDIDNSKDRYTKYIEGQLNAFINNLKGQLDQILEDYEKNKNNIEKHVAHMEILEATIQSYVQEIEQIKDRDKATV